MIVNKAALEDLINDIGADATARVLEVFLAEMGSQVKDIRTNLNAEHLDSIVKLAHTLKSTSATFGAITLNGFAFQVEMAARNRNTDSLGDLVAALERCAQETTLLYTPYTD